MQGIDIENVSRWLDDNVSKLTGPYRFELIAGGRSNLTFRGEDSIGTPFVLRRPPTGHVLESAHDMAREHRLITAVGKTTVPVPRTYGLCTDPAVNDAPFYVMECVAGEVLDDPDKVAPMSIELRQAASEHLFDVLADLHDVDVDAVGLGDLSKRDGYVERQLRRWTKQWEASKTEDLPVVDEVAARLHADIPTQQGVAIVHGDFRFGNCITDTTTGRIKAVLDWELCTLGDPLADLGYLGVGWGGQGERGVAARDPSGQPGFPTFAEMVQRYTARTGRDVSRLGYYVAFQCWRLAVISQGVRARYMHGAMGDQDIDLENARLAVIELAERAAAELG